VVDISIELYPLLGHRLLLPVWLIHFSYWIGFQSRRMIGVLT